MGVEVFRGEFFFSFSLEKKRWWDMVSEGTHHGTVVERLLGIERYIEAYRSGGMSPKTFQLNILRQKLHTVELAQLSGQ
ncbi:hypothetical protein AYI69_g3027 [Smittium culicis]|uniref:Uncharacterized protein n=1 Tax=Smittium culicis TaxID=133412 RepID=A0A1R1YKV4_9FUNG|nr:hypothetical protein AYI69_g3027 [Smittium culicis]